MRRVEQRVGIKSWNRASEIVACKSRHPFYANLHPHGVRKGDHRAHVLAFAAEEGRTGFGRWSRAFGPRNDRGHGANFELRPKLAEDLVDLFMARIVAVPDKKWSKRIRASPARKVSESRSVCTPNPSSRYRHYETEQTTNTIEHQRATKSEQKHPA